MSDDTNETVDDSPLYPLAALQQMAREVIDGASPDRQAECAPPLARFVLDFCEVLEKKPDIFDPLPIDVEEVEGLARAFLLGAFVCVTGGFPSVAFHDGYREYDERMEGWLAGRSSNEQKRQWETEYAAGAFARLLEEEGVEI